MHELAIAGNIIRILEKQAKNLKKVKKVNLKIGVMKAVVPEALETAFDVITAGTKFEGVKISIKSSPLKAYCAECKKEYKYGDTFSINFNCVKCGSSNLSIKSGEELLIESIEGD